MTDKLQAEVERLKPRMFPIQDGDDIPWAVIEPCEEQAKRNHGHQSLERLAERQGLGCAEAIAVLECHEFRFLDDTEASAQLHEIVRERWYLPRLQQAEAENAALRVALEGISELANEGINEGGSTAAEHLLAIFNDARQTLATGKRDNAEAQP